MTSELVCPFCGEELFVGDAFIDVQYANCRNPGCKQCGVVMPVEIWQALIQAKQDLEIARKALEEIKKVCDGCRWCDSNLYDPTPSDGRRIAETTNNALEQIEHKEEK